MLRKHSKSKRKRKSWLLWSLGIGCALITVLVAFHFFEINQLQNVKSNISVGDNRAKVESLLGKAHIAYSSGYLNGDYATPTTFSSCYGGALNRVRQQFDSLLVALLYWPESTRVLADRYVQYAAQSPNNWPAVITYDENDNVIFIK